MQAIFDFDDTLYPTSWCELNSSSSSMFNELDETIQQLMNCLIDHGWKIAIITNADMGWIHTASDFLPLLKKRYNKDIELHSARNEHESYIPWEEWKYTTVLHLLTKPGEAIKEVVGFGDHINDHDSVSRACTVLNSKFHFFQVKREQSPSELSLSLKKLIPMFNREPKARLSHESM